MPWQPAVPPIYLMRERRAIPAAARRKISIELSNFISSVDVQSLDPMERVAIEDLATGFGTELQKDEPNQPTVVRWAKRLFRVAVRLCGRPPGKSLEEFLSGMG
jgi:hypothetical protein